MKISDIEKLARIMRAEGIGMLEIDQDDTHIRMESACAAVNAPVQVMNVTPPPAAQPAVPSVRETTVDFNSADNVTSPMVGVFYAAPAPDADAYVKVGSKVKKGDVLCIVEAMKLMNEINAPRDGEIVDICVANGDVVEFGQTLFKMC